MYYFIVNPRACRGCSDKIWKRLERWLNIKNIDYQVLLTAKAGDARFFAQELTESAMEPRTIIVVGGDGTFNEVIDGMSFTGMVTLGYVPIGMSSSLARSLRLPKRPFKCLRLMLNSTRQKSLDYGVLSYGETVQTHKRFAVSCGIGLDAAVCHILQEQPCSRKPRFFRPGRLQYIIVAIGQILNSKPVKGYIVLDGVKRMEFNHLCLVAAHIHPYGSGGLKLAPGADASDGYLELCILHNPRRMRLLSLLADALYGRIKNRKGVRFYRCREVQIHTDRPMPVHVDGEDCQQQTDIHLGCVEKKIRMIV